MTHVRFRDDCRKAIRKIRESSCCLADDGDQYEEDLMVSPLRAAHWLLPAAAGLASLRMRSGASHMSAVPEAIKAFREGHVPSRYVAQALDEVASWYDEDLVREFGNKRAGEMIETLNYIRAVPLEFWQAVIDGMITSARTHCRHGDHPHDLHPSCFTWYSGWWETCLKLDQCQWSRHLFYLGLTASKTRTEWNWPQWGRQF